MVLHFVLFQLSEIEHVKVIILHCTK